MKVKHRNLLSQYVPGSGRIRWRELLLLAFSDFGVGSSGLWPNAVMPLDAVRDVIIVQVQIRPVELGMHRFSWSKTFSGANLVEPLF